MNYERAQLIFSDLIDYQQNRDEDLQITFTLISNHCFEVFFSDLVNIKEENCFFVKRKNSSFYIDYSEITDIIY